MNLSTVLRERMTEAGIDVDRSLHILERLNAGAYDHVEPVRASGIPTIDGRRIIDRTKPARLRVPETEYHARMGEIAAEIPLESFGSCDTHEGTRVRTLDETDLQQIGILLYPYVAYGVLNGGSATSFADEKKNRALDAQLFELYRRPFNELARAAHGRPKGLTAAYVNPDGSPGASFLELKFRAVALAAQRYDELAKQLDVTPPARIAPMMPVFEMTSAQTDGPLHEAYVLWKESPYLRGLAYGAAVLQTESAVQPLLAAFTHSADGSPRRVFDRAWGKLDSPLGLPGGHGQNFQTLAPIYRRLLQAGKRFVYVGNVDNVGFVPDPVSIALLALTGRQAGFDFAFRTPVDLKGGVLLYDQAGQLNCADIGAAISLEDVLAAERSGTPILFNCATGLFSLPHLVERLDEIVEDLPMRISDQDKDAGRYSQAEQITWEIIGMIDDCMVFGIDKYRRFLAAKMLLETLLTSGVDAERAAHYQPTVAALHNGLRYVLQDVLDMRLEGGRWVPAETGNE